MLHAATWSILVLTLVLAASCGPDVDQQAREITGGGEPSRGQAAVVKYGCPACHTIPRVPGASGLVGPPLTGIAARVYIGGVLENTPDNMMQWVRNPRRFSPRTAMPNTGVTEQDARDIAAFLYTLRQ